MTLKKKAAKKRSKRNQYTVVLEDLRSQFRVFGEGLGFVSDKLDSHTRRFDGIDIKLRELKIELTVIKERLTRAETASEFVKDQLSIIRHNQVTRDEFKLLETRVARLEKIRA